MIGGLQGEEWKFIQKYLKKRSKRVGAQISQFACRFRTLHGKLKNHFLMLDFTANAQLPSTLNFARWSSNFARWEIVLQLMQLSSEGYIFLISAPNRTRFEELDS